MQIENILSGTMFILLKQQSPLSQFAGFKALKNRVHSQNTVVKIGFLKKEDLFEFSRKSISTSIDFGVSVGGKHCLFKDKTYFKSPCYDFNCIFLTFPA